MNGPSAFELQGNERSARVALWSQRYLCFSSGPALYAMGFGRVRFTLRDLAPPRLVRSVAQPVFHPSRGAALFFNVADWLSDLAVRSNSFTSRPQLGGDAAGDRARDRSGIGPVGWRSLHVSKHGASDVRASEKFVRVSGENRRECDR